MARNQELLIKHPASSYLQNRVEGSNHDGCVGVMQWHYSTFPAEMGVTRANKKYGSRRAV